MGVGMNEQPAEVNEITPSCGAARRGARIPEAAPARSERPGWISLPKGRRFTHRPGPIRRMVPPASREEGRPEGRPLPRSRALLRVHADRAGETTMYVWDQMGHLTIRVTFDTCGHLWTPFPPVASRGRSQSASHDAPAQRQSEWQQSGGRF